MRLRISSIKKPGEVAGLFIAHYLVNMACAYNAVYDAAYALLRWNGGHLSGRHPVFCEASDAFFYAGTIAKKIVKKVKRGEILKIE